MSRVILNRLERLESKLADPAEPWLVYLPRRFENSPEAEADFQAYKAINPGRNIVRVRVVDGRKPAPKSDEQPAPKHDPWAEVDAYLAKEGEATA